MEHPTLNVVFNEEGYVHRLEGGIPEIDGRDASALTPDQLQATLGPASRTGKNRLIGGSETITLSFPDHRLLVERQNNENRFILFRAGR